MNPWRQVWERKGSPPVGDGYDLATLLAMDGFDAGAGALPAEGCAALVNVVRTELALRPGMSLLEVGCGAGALLWCLRDDGLELFGIDYSAALIEHAKAAIPEATFAVAEAIDIPFEADALLCHSVFQYFPDYGYARRAIEAFLRAAPVALVMDIPDLATKEESEAMRQASGSKRGRHLYFPRSFFEPARTWTSEVPGYGNAPFRFHAHFR
jgi:SAM-dependent methyltransferase